MGWESMMSKDMAISQIMQTEVHTLTADAKVSEARRLMREYGIHHLPIVDAAGQLLGIVSHTDLLTLGYDQELGGAASIDEFVDLNYALADVMEDAVATLGSRRTLADAAERLSTGSFHSLPVVDDGELVGIVTSTDLIRVLHEMLRED